MVSIRTWIDGRQLPLAVIAVVASNVAVFLVQQSLTPPEFNLMIYKYGMVPYHFFGGGRFPNGRPLWETWTLLTAGFQHANWLHLLLNMWMLWMFAPHLEHRLGTLNFLLFYLCSIVASSFAYGYFDPYADGPLIGASGGIAGVIGAHSLLFPRGRLNLLLIRLPLIPRVPVLAFVAVWFGQEIFAVLNPGELAPGLLPEGQHVASWAHIGGIAAGLTSAAVIRLLRRTETAGI